MAARQIHRSASGQALAFCLAAAVPLPAAAQSVPLRPAANSDALTGDLRPAAPPADLRRGDEPARLSDGDIRLNDELNPSEALDAEARAAAEDEADGGDGAADAGTSARRARAPGAPAFDLFSEPERPASARDRPSVQAQPAAPEPFAAAGPAVAETDDPLAPAEARPGDALLRPGLSAERDALSSATTQRALSVRPVGRIEDARPDLFGEARPRAASPRNPLPSVDPDDPFAATGIRAGSFVLYPTLVQTLGATTNIESEPGAESGIFSETTLSGRLLSDWSRHEAEANASLTYRRNFQGELRDDPRLSADGRLRFDLGARMGATLRGAISYRRDDPADDDVLGASGERPETFDGTLAADLERSFGRVLLRGTGSLARSVETSSIAGVPDERYTTATAAIRAGYELSPALQPFAEASLGRRLFDSSPLPGGEGPDATISALRTGTTFRFSEKLFGEAAAGYAWSDPDEPRFRATRSPTLDALLTWSPRRGTDVTLTASTRFDPGSEGLSSETVYDASLGLRHRLLARAEIDGRLGARFTDTTVTGGDEMLLSFESGVTYWLSRMAALTALYRHETLDSDRSGQDWSADTIQFGLRFQR